MAVAVRMADGEPFWGPPRGEGDEENQRACVRVGAALAQKPQVEKGTSISQNSSRGIASRRANRDGARSEMRPGLLRSGKPKARVSARTMQFVQKPPGPDAVQQSGDHFHHQQCCLGTQLISRFSQISMSVEVERYPKVLFP